MAKKKPTRQARGKKNKGKKKNALSLTGQIINALRKAPGRQLALNQMRKKIKGKVEPLQIEKAVAQLLTDNSIREVKKFRYQLTQPAMLEKTIQGVVDMTFSRSAYIVSDDISQDIYVQGRNLKNAMDGDLVKVQLLKRRSGKPEGMVVEIVERAQTQFVGTIRLTNTDAYLQPSKAQQSWRIAIPKADLMDAKQGERALVEVVDWDKMIGKVRLVLGEDGTHDVEMRSILLEHGFPLFFSNQTEKEVENMSEEITEAELKKRKDFRDISTFTIDPDDAKDFDDALSIRKLDNGHWEIGIHIADVSHYVRPGTSLDKDARKRATSVYLVDRVLPMLPEKLSNGLCSLRPNEDKLCFAVVVEIDDEAKIHNKWIGRTVIHSDNRFTYDEVKEVMDAKKGTFSTELIQLNSLAKLLRKKRFEQGSIGFETVEIQFLINKQGDIVGIQPKVRHEAHLLIEDFMLLANRIVAKWGGHTADKKSREFVYRVHDLPDPVKMETFSTFAGGFGYKIDTSSSQGFTASLNRLMVDLKGKPEQDLLEKMAIRSMAKAYYTTHNIGHYGLAFSDYSHFTSPIRRYPDLMVHRLIEQYQNKQGKASEKDLESQSKHCSVMEKRAVEAERDSVKYKQIEFMQNKIGQEFDGIISGVIEWGLFVELIETRSEGLVRVEHLPDDDWVYKESEMSFKGRGTGLKYRMGDKVRIKLVKTDLDRRQMDFEMVQNA